MLQMGFSQEEIQDSLVNQKYNDVMATYLLLDYRNSEVRSLHGSYSLTAPRRHHFQSVGDLSCNHNDLIFPFLCRIHNI